MTDDRHAIGRRWERGEWYRIQDVELYKSKHTKCPNWRKQLRITYHDRVNRGISIVALLGSQTPLLPIKYEVREGYDTHIQYINVIFTADFGPWKKEHSCPYLVLFEDEGELQEIRDGKIIQQCELKWVPR